jgi:hypothetical protein
VRKCLGVLAGLAALCAMSWAQATAPATTPAPTSAPAPTTASTPDQAPAPAPATISTPVEKPTAPPIQYPRLELFGGGTYAEAGPFNAGHWAGLSGWDASLGLNATHWLGFIVEGGQYFGTAKIPSTVGLPFPPCGSPNGYCPTTTPTFDVTTRQYDILFGAQFSRRKYVRWTPFGEILYGHGGTRGEVPGFAEVSGGRSLVAGGGLDYKINPRFALRLKADYLQTATDYSSLGKLKQDNFRFSAGVVIRSVHKTKRTLEDETQPLP